MRPAVQHATWIGRGRGDGSELPAGGLDHFASDVSSSANAGSAIGYQAIYDSATTTTFFAYEGWDGTNRLSQISSYNHTSRIWAGPYTAFTSVLVDDDHGSPWLVMDHQGYLWMGGGVHNANSMIVTSSVNPKNISSWNATTTPIGTGTYGQPFLVGSQLYVLWRDGSANGQCKLSRTTALSGGVATWAAAVVIGDMSSASSRWYNGHGYVDPAAPTEIVMACTRADAADTFRQDVFVYRLDTVGLQLKNFDRSLTSAFGVNLTTLKASYRVVDQETGATNGNVPDMFLTNTHPHIAYMDGTDPNWNVKVTWHDGSSWHAPVTMGAIPTTNALHRYDSFCLTDTGTNDVVDAYWLQDGSVTYSRGGKVVKRRKNADGSLGTLTDVKLIERTSPYDGIMQVQGGHANARMVFAERCAAGLAASENNGRDYAYGDGGLLARPITAASGVNVDFTTGAYRGTTFWTERERPDTMKITVVFGPNTDGTLVPFTGYNQIRVGTAGLYVEPTQINLIGNNRNVGSSGWSLTNCTVAMNLTGRDGTVNGASTLTKSTAQTGRRTSYTATGTANSTVSLIAYLKAGTKSTACIRFVQNSPSQVTCKIFDLTTGAISNSSTPETTGFVAATATDVGDSWWKCVLVVTTPATGTSHQFWVCPGDINGDSTTGTIGVDFCQMTLGNHSASNISPIFSSTNAAWTRYQDEVYFGIPAKVNTLRFTFDDSTIQDVDVTAANKGAYMIPTTLNRRIIKTVHGF